MKNMMKFVVISDTQANYWICTTVKNTELLKDKEL